VEYEGAYYTLGEGHKDFVAGQKYVVDIEDCTVMPQCYAAIAENLADFKGMNMIADIGI
jgi:plasmid segregation protein ParM